MAYLTMQTRELIDKIGSEGASTTALGSIAQLYGKIDEIEKTIVGLSEVWDDEAQRVYMGRFMTTSAAIKVYLSELKILTDEIKAAVGQVTTWDKTFSTQLGVR